MNDVTIIYYTANTEDEVFENNIRKNILKNSNGLPIISVSRKPIDFGKNICVGEKPVCYSNSFRQLQIGLDAAETEFCICAEADCLYPPEYFSFVPDELDRVYRYMNVYVYFDGKNAFWRKPWSEGSQMCGREYWISRIENLIGAYHEWEPIEDNNYLKHVFSTRMEQLYSWTGKVPVITFKTRNGVNYKTGFIGGSSKELPMWGNARELYEGLCQT
jgi:hypothetical protein